MKMQDFLENSPAIQRLQLLQYNIMAQKLFINLIFLRKFQKDSVFFSKKKSTEEPQKLHKDLKNINDLINLRVSMQEEFSF